MRNIFFDFDGTLIDSKKRILSVFNHLNQPYVMEEDEYWNCKRKKMSNEWILENKFSRDKIFQENFKSQFLSVCENESFLHLDLLFPYTKGTLEILKNNKNNLFIVTGRQHKNEVINQIKNFGIHHYFTTLCVTEQKVTKPDLVASLGIKLGKEDIFIGDTEEDIEAGKKLGINTIAVLSGFRSKDFLEKLRPNRIAEDITCLLDFN